MPVLVRDMSTRAGRPGVFGIRAVEQSLRVKRRDFAGSYAQFADANLRARTTYVEGRAQRYPSTSPRADRTVSTSTSGTFTLDHMTSASAPVSGRRRPAPGSTLIDVNMPAVSQGSWRSPPWCDLWVREHGSDRSQRRHWRPESRRRLRHRQHPVCEPDPGQREHAVPELRERELYLLLQRDADLRQPILVVGRSSDELTLRRDRPAGGDPRQRLAYDGRVGGLPHRRQAGLEERAVARRRPAAGRGRRRRRGRWSCGSAGPSPAPAAARRGSRRPP